MKKGCNGDHAVVKCKAWTGSSPSRATTPPRITGTDASTLPNPGIIPIAPARPQRAEPTRHHHRPRQQLPGTTLPRPLKNASATDAEKHTQGRIAAHQRSTDSVLPNPHLDARANLLGSHVADTSTVRHQRHRAVIAIDTRYRHPARYQSKGFPKLPQNV